ncbi:MAG: hypothetical protein JHC33_02485 [Ignisphaera sp.]|jgi:hypothetical protein|nr:hypothetical protein [Ignisphaera sp.]
MGNEKRQTNKDFAMKDSAFAEACGKAEVQPTRRQASKFRRGYGKAYKFKN